MRRLVLSAFALSTSLLVVSTARAATFNVTTTFDAGAGSLREAMTSANASAGPHTITFTAVGTIELSSTLPTLANDVTIVGPGASKLVIGRLPAAPQFALLTTTAALKVSGVTLSNGFGGIDAQGTGLLEVSDCVLEGNTGIVGGAIFAMGPLQLTRSTVTENFGSDPAALLLRDTATIVDSTISNNAKGAIVFFPKTTALLTIDHSTISNNATVSGNPARGTAGLEIRSGNAVVTNSTFSGNESASGYPGDISVNVSSSLSLTNVTLAGSSAPSLQRDAQSLVKVTNTIFAGTGERCAMSGQPGPFAAGSTNNLSTDATCLLTAASDKQGVDPLLSPLANNGGLTMTHMLLAGSPAINAGASTGVAATDQRGFPRIAGVSVDLGAVESDAHLDAGADAGADGGVGADGGAGPAGGSPDGSIGEGDGGDGSTAGAQTSSTAGDASTGDGGCGCTAAGVNVPAHRVSLLFAGLALAAAVILRRTGSRGAPTAPRVDVVGPEQRHRGPPVLRRSGTACR